MTIHANSMNFTYFLWLIAGVAEDPGRASSGSCPVAAGGSFGSKFFMHKVPTFAGFLSMLAGRPVKYVEDRVTHIVNNDHCGSDRRYEAALAFDDDGDVPGAADRRASTTTAPTSSSAPARTATPSRRSSGRTGSSTSSTRSPRC